MLDTIHIGTSGMSAYSSALKSISNNVSNMNTPGFKAGTGSFANLVSGGASAGGLQAGSGEQGQGVQFNPGPLNFDQGDLKTTTGALDLAIDGRGFMVLNSAAGQRLYARTGQFELKDGQVQQLQTGHQLMVKSPTGGLVVASVKGLETNAPQASTTVRFSGNLSLDALATEHTVSNVVVIDSLGARHVLSVSFAAATTQAGPLNEKAVSVKDDKGVEIKAGKVAFSLAGSVDTASARLVVDVTAVGGGKTSVTLDFLGLTGFSSGATSNVAAEKADGHALGTLSSVNVTDTGTLEIVYSNGEKKEIGAVALADFDNVQDLRALDSGGFEYGGSGTPVLRVSSQDGMGKVLGLRQESSNVDLTAEFGELILVQRGYQASSQILSAANEMLGQLFDLRGQR
jgi:flagellar hook protein FlgE